MYCSEMQILISVIGMTIIVVTSWRAFIQMMWFSHRKGGLLQQCGQISVLRYRPLELDA